jgi:hypothetical protein
MKLQLKLNDKIQVEIHSQHINGTVTGTGQHNGKSVVDFNDAEGSGRFCYTGQIKTINGADINEVLRTQNS